jgi:hypothetical protein
MGSLDHFNLNNYIQKYNIEYLIETGTYKGDAVQYALQFNLKNIYSVELIKEFYEYSSKRFENNKNVKIINNTSKKGLIEILSKKEIKNCLFWLDAHLPNFYQKQYGGDYNKNKELLIPLEDEIKTIIANKNISNDIFIIDDLRIYEIGNFQKGNWNGVIIAGVGGIDFIYELLGKTHTIQKLYDDEGYIICTPKLK